MPIDLLVESDVVNPELEEASETETSVADAPPALAVFSTVALTVVELPDAADAGDALRLTSRLGLSWIVTVPE